MEEMLKHNRINFNLDILEVYDWDKPVTSVYIEFFKQNGKEILELGQFEALRRWLLTKPDCILLPITEEKSVGMTRHFFKCLLYEK